MWSDIFIAFMIAFLVSYVVTPYTVRLAKKVGALDNPKTSSRKIHKKITPRLGGIAIIAGLIASTTYLFVTMSIEKKINLFDDEKYIFLSKINLENPNGGHIFRNNCIRDILLF